MGYLNGILAWVGGNLNNNFQKSQMPGGLPGGGMLKPRFDRYIMIMIMITMMLTVGRILCSLCHDTMQMDIPRKDTMRRLF